MFHQDTKANQADTEITLATDYIYFQYSQTFYQRFIKQDIVTAIKILEVLHP